MHTGKETSEVFVAQQGPSDGSVVKSAKLNSAQEFPHNFEHLRTSAPLML